MPIKKETLVQKARNEAARFYFGNLPGYVEDWIDDTTNNINLAEDVDKDVRDLAELLVKFHKECQREGL